MSISTVDISPLGLGLIAILMGTNGMLTLAMNLQVRSSVQSDDFFTLFFAFSLHDTFIECKHCFKTNYVADR
jgi:hypothetical protein